MKGNANQGPVHDEFEPLCKWQRREEHDVLEIHLPEFKKDQLKVQISNHGMLKVSGERPIGSSRKSKFYKEFQLSSKYDSHAIHAKFVNGWLYITIAKRRIFAPDEKDGKERVGPSKTDHHQTPTDEPHPNEQMQTDGNASTVTEFDHRRKPATSSRRLAIVAVTAASSVAMVAILVAYLVYMYRSTLPEVD